MNQGAGAMTQAVCEIVYETVYYHIAHVSCAGTCAIIAQQQDNNSSNVTSVYNKITFFVPYDISKNGWQYIVSHYWTHWTQESQSDAGLEEETLLPHFAPESIYWRYVSARQIWYGSQREAV